MDVLKALRRLTLMFMAVLILGVGTVQAQDTELQDEWDRLHAECMDEDKTREGTVARFLADNLPDGVTDAVESGFCMDSIASDDPKLAIEKVTSEFWDDPIGKFVKSVIEGHTQIIQTMMTFWMDMSFDSVDMFNWSEGVRNIVWYLAIAGFTINLAIIGARIAWSRRQGLADGIEDAGQMFWNIAIYGVLVPGGIFGAIATGDALSEKIMSRFGVTDADTFLAGTDLGESVAGPILMLALALFTFIGSMTQMIAMAARTLLLPLMIGLLPMFAGLTATEWGKAALSSMKNWVIALIAFKPLAALIYVVAFWISGKENEDEQGLMWTVTRMLVVGIAGFSVIMVAKIIVPMVGSMGGGNSAAVGAGMAAATGAATAGAMALTGGLAGGAGKALSGMAGKAATGSGVGSGGSSGRGPTGSGTTGGPSGGPSGGDGGGATQAPSTGATAAGATKTTGARASSAPTAAGGPKGAGRGRMSRATGGAGAVLTAVAGGSKIAGRAAQNGTRGFSHHAHTVQNISDDSLGSAGHPGQVTR